MKLDVIFDEAPSMWGLRGDPYLWNELKEDVRQRPVFKTADEFLLYLKATIEDIIGEPLLKGRYPYVERFNSGGMYGGRIDSDFWLNTIMPLLEHRFNNLGRNP
jgi:hypothetical protein